MPRGGLCPSCDVAQQKIHGQDPHRLKGQNVKAPHICVGLVAQSVSRLTTGWTVGGSNPGGARFSAVQTGPGAHPASCTMRTGSFPREKRPGRAADHSPPSSAVVMEE